MSRWSLQSTWRFSILPRWGTRPQWIGWISETTHHSFFPYTRHGHHSHWNQGLKSPGGNLKHLLRLGHHWFGKSIFWTVCRTWCCRMMFRKHLFSLQGMQYQLYVYICIYIYIYIIYIGLHIYIYIYTYIYIYIVYIYICICICIYTYNIYTHVIICLCLYCLYVYLEKQMSTYCPWKHCLLLRDTLSEPYYGQVFVGQCLGLRNGWMLSTRYLPDSSCNWLVKIWIPVSTGGHLYT